MGDKQSCIRILLVEDNPTDVLLLQEALGNLQQGMSFSIRHAESLRSAIAALDAEDFDICLLDLGLPDSRGLESFTSLREHADNLPILIITALEDEKTAVKAVKLGAQDFLIKSEVPRSLLGRFIRFAIERHKLQQELESVREKRQREREVASMERMSSSEVVTSVTSGLYSGKPLYECAPDEFDQVTRKYSEILDLAFESRIHRGGPEYSDHIRQLGYDLGFLRASPRDVIDVHTRVLRDKTRQTPLKKAQTIHEEGRMIVLELMGTLTGYYRSLTIGLHARETDHANR